MDGTISNSELLEIWENNGRNATTVASIVGRSPSTVRERINKLTENRTAKEKRLEAIDAALQEKGIDPRDVLLKRARIRDRNWQVGAKITDENGVEHMEVTDLAGTGVEIEFEPKWKDGPAWPVIQPGPAITVAHTPPTPHPVRRHKVALVFGDEQVGFWRDIATEKYSAFQDEFAMDCVLQLISAVRPDVIVLDGDTGDFPGFSGKFRKHPEFAFTAQRTINRLTLWMAQIRAAAGEDCEIVMLEGNHDARLANYIIDNAAEAFGLRPGFVQGMEPGTWPSYSIPALLHLDRFNITYSSAFPAGCHWLNEGLVVQHKDEKIGRSEYATVVHGHLHRAFEEWKTVHYRSKRITRGIISIGALAKTGSIVGQMDRRLRSEIPAAQVNNNWQQSALVLHYDPKGFGLVDREHPLIVDGRMMFRGTEIVGRKRDIDGNLATSKTKKR